jgi:hypothetical protein
VAAGPPERPTLKEWSQRGARSARAPVEEPDMPSPLRRMPTSKSLKDCAGTGNPVPYSCHNPDTHCGGLAVATSLQTWASGRCSRQSGLATANTRDAPDLIACAPCGWGPDLERSD